MAAGGDSTAAAPKRSGNRHSAMGTMFCNIGGHVVTILPSQGARIDGVHGDNCSVQQVQHGSCTTELSGGEQRRQKTLIGQ